MEEHFSYEVCFDIYFVVPGFWLDWTNWANSVAPSVQVRYRACNHPPVHGPQYCCNPNEHSKQACVGEDTQTRVTSLPQPQQPAVSHHDTPGRAPLQEQAPQTAVHAHGTVPGPVQQPAVQAPVQTAPVPLNDAPGAAVEPSQAATGAALGPVDPAPIPVQGPAAVEPAVAETPEKTEAPVEPVAQIGRAHVNSSHQIHPVCRLRPEKKKKTQW